MNFKEHDYFIKELSYYLDNLKENIGGEKPTKLSVFNHSPIFYDGMYGNIIQMELTKGFFSFVYKYTDDRGNKLSGLNAEYNIPLKVIIPQNEYDINYKVIGTYSIVTVIQKNGLLGDNDLVIVDNFTRKPEITNNVISFTNPVKHEYNGAIFYECTLSINSILANITAPNYGYTPVDYPNYGGNVQYTRMDNYFKQIIASTVPEPFEYENAVLSHFKGINPNVSRYQHSALPFFCFGSDEEFISNSEKTENGDVTLPYDTTKSKNINFVLYVNGNVNADYVLKIESTKSIDIDILFVDFNQLVLDKHWVYHPITGSWEKGENIPFYKKEKINSESKYFRFKFDDYYNPYKEESNLSSSGSNSFIMFLNYSIEDKEYSASYNLRRKVIKREKNYMETDDIDMMTDNVSYTYPMGVIAPYGFSLATYMSTYATKIDIVYASDGTDDNPDLADDDDTPKDDIIQDDDETNTLVTASGTLTTTYKIDENTTRQIGGFLWRNNIFENFELLLNSPIENLLSVKMIPVDAPANNQQPIVIGNVDLETIGGREVTSTNVIINIGTVDMSQLNKYGNFIDLPPYTKYVIYLPYIGFREFDGSCCLNKSLNVRYSIDLVTGACLAMLYVSNKFKVAEYEGNMGIDIPISASNRGNTESAIISGLADAAISLNPVNIPSAIANSVFAQYSYQSKGAPSPTCLASANRTCYILIDRPQYTPIKSFAHTKGLYCNKTKTIGNCKGFTICDVNIDLSNIPLTSGEIDELRQILSSGFYA